MNKNRQQIHFSLYDSPNVRLIFDNRGRKFLREILSVTKKPQSARTRIEKKLGKGYIKEGQKSLHAMGGRQETPKNTSI